MATAAENLNKHLLLAVRQLEIISGTVAEIRDSTFELVDQIYGLLISLTDPGIPREMKGPEIVAALRGIINTTTLITLEPKDKEDILRILELIKLCIYHKAYNSNAPNLLD